MRELSLKFVYQGRDSFINLSCKMAKHMGPYNRCSHWEGWIKMGDEKIYTDGKEFFICISTKIRDTLKDRKNIPVEIYLFSNDDKYPGEVNFYPR